MATKNANKNAPVETVRASTDAAFPPVAGRPGFVAMPWTAEDGFHRIKARKVSNGPLIELAAYAGTTLPFPSTREALQAACAGDTFTLPGGVVVIGAEAKAARILKHEAESLRGEERIRLLEGGKPDATGYQGRINGAAPVIVSKAELSAMTHAELVELAAGLAQKKARKTRR